MALGELRPWVPPHELGSLFSGASASRLCLAFVSSLLGQSRTGFQVGNQPAFLFAGLAPCAIQRRRVWRRGFLPPSLHHVNPLIFSCSFQQDLCLIKLPSFIIIKEKCGGRAVRTVFNENQIVDPAGKQGPPCCSRLRPGNLLHRATERRQPKLSTEEGFSPDASPRKVAGGSGPAQACHCLACILLGAGRRHPLLPGRLGEWLQVSVRTFSQGRLGA